MTASGIAFELRHYEHDPRAASYGLEAAEALGVEPARVFKTLLATLDGRSSSASSRSRDSSTSRPWRGRSVAAGPRWPRSARPSAPRATSQAASPRRPEERHRTVLDESARDHSTIFVSGGRRGLDLEIAPADLVAITEAITAQIGR